MRELYLLRHAKAGGAAGGGDDHERALSAIGEAEARAVGAYMRRTGLTPALALCSTARRATETFGLLISALDRHILVEYDHGLYMAGAGDMIARLAKVEDAASVLLVGHNPGIEALAARLTGPTVGPGIHSPYPAGGFAVLRLRIDAWKSLKPGYGDLVTFFRPVA